MKEITLNGIEYEIIENIDDCLNEEEISEKLTEYFTDFDYVFGDFSYDKVRLKGYNDSNNKKAKKINDIAGLEDYKKNYCSYGAKTFLLKKIKKIK